MSMPGDHPPRPSRRLETVTPHRRRVGLARVRRCACRRPRLVMPHGLYTEMTVAASTLLTAKANAPTSKVRTAPSSAMSPPELASWPHSIAAVTTKLCMNENAQVITTTASMSFVKTQ